MSDQTAPSAEPNLMLRMQYLKDLSFENPLSPEIYSTLARSPDISVNIDVTARPLPTAEDFEIVLAITASAKLEDKTVFVIELTYGAVFQVAGFPKESLQPILLIEIPRLMFPFARNIVADVTRDSGFPPLLIHPVDFVALYRQKFEPAAGQA
ncbi:MAG: protein-export chaperone SecB [Alphaproteobacteria bacterium]